MNFSDNFIRLMSDNLRSKQTFRVNNSNVDLNGQTLISKIIEIPLTESIIEVPWFAKDYITLLINNLNDDTTSAIIPLQTVERTYGARPASADTIIKYFIRNTNFGEIIKVITTKEEIYYGTNGLIFDKNFNFIFAGTVNIEKCESNKYLYSALNLHINPKVFIEQDNVIHKSLIKKVIPYFLSDICLSRSFFNRYSNYSETLPVNIKVGMPNFIKNINKPNCAEGLDKEINDLLLNSTSELSSILQYDITV